MMKRTVSKFKSLGSQVAIYSVVVAILGMTPHLARAYDLPTFESEKEFKLACSDLMVKATKGTLVFAEDSEDLLPQAKCVNYAVMQLLEQTKNQEKHLLEISQSAGQKFVKPTALLTFSISAVSLLAIFSKGTWARFTSTQGEVTARVFEATQFSGRTVVSGTSGRLLIGSVAVSATVYEFESIKLNVNVKELKALRTELQKMNRYLNLVQTDLLKSLGAN